MSIAERLKAARAALRLKQDEIVAISGIPLDTYRKYEGGKSEPGAKALAGLAKAGIDLNWLITGTSYVTDESGKQFFAYPAPSTDASAVAEEPVPAHHAAPMGAKINAKALSAIIEGLIKAGAPAEKVGPTALRYYQEALDDGLITPDGIGDGGKAAA